MNTYKKMFSLGAIISGIAGIAIVVGSLISSSNELRGNPFGVICTLPVIVFFGWLIFYSVKKMRTSSSGRQIFKVFVLNGSRETLEESIRNTFQRTGVRLRNVTGVNGETSFMAQFTPHFWFEKNLGLICSITPQGNDIAEVKINGQEDSFHDRFSLYGKMNQIHFQLNPDGDKVAKEKREYRGTDYFAKFYESDPTYSVITGAEPKWPDLCHCCCGTPTTFDKQDVDITYFEDNGYWHGIVKFKIPICDCCIFHRTLSFSSVSSGKVLDLYEYGLPDAAPACIHHLRNNQVGIHSIIKEHDLAIVKFKVSEVRYSFRNLDYAKAFAELNKAGAPTIIETTAKK